MALLAYTDVKEMLGLNTTKYDVQIQKLLPGSIRKAFSSTNNYFHIPGQFIISSNISFDATVKKIISSNSDFSDPQNLTIELQQGLFIHISQSVLNDGFFKIDSLSGDELLLDSNEILKNEAEGAEVRIDVMTVPEDFLMSVARYIGEIIGKQSGVKNERIGNYSVTYSDEKEALESLFEDYRRINWK